ncbi:putative uncharacterized domain protein [Bifidobacterium animalis subsp. lactis CECT 8145]|nr:hypothetical protein W91_0647 [Bifidobacterium animalis subsp. lactis Bi-07]AJD33743.1 hypothetical protein BAA6_0630 [Bifidobacterium animalis]QIR80661.1 hypothetical protein M8PIadj_0643 [Bifidobacterium animalis]CDL71752.1 putative uncharacterized domain protein [Bifidobacterium animalis subsp. lactis CECT 8145]
MPAPLYSHMCTVVHRFRRARTFASISQTCIAWSSHRIFLFARRQYTASSHHSTD